MPRGKEACKQPPGEGVGKAKGAPRLVQGWPADPEGPGEESNSRHLLRARFYAVSRATAVSKTDTFPALGPFMSWRGRERDQSNYNCEKGFKGSIFYLGSWEGQADT